MLFENANGTFNLGDPRQQAALLTFCVELGIKVLILDNVSTLISGIEENSADGWGNAIAPWLREFRRRNISVIVICHAGRNKNIRGTSKREDDTFWIINLESKECEGSGNKTRFISIFLKDRNARVPSYDWLFEEADGKEKVTWREADNLDILVQLVNEGVTSCEMIHEELGLSKSQVSRLAHKAIQQGRIKKDGRDYVPVKDD